MPERLSTMGRLRRLNIFGSHTPEKEMSKAFEKFGSIYKAKIEVASRDNHKQFTFEAKGVSMKLTRTPTGSILFITEQIEEEEKNAAIVLDHAGSVTDYLNTTDKNSLRVWSKAERSGDTACEIQKYAKVLKGAKIIPVLGNDVTLAGDVRAIFEALSPTE